MTFLPKKFSCTKEWLRIFKFPTLDKRKGLEEKMIKRTRHTTTLFHWLSFSGRSRWDWIHLAYAGYMIVSLVGRTAIGLSNSLLPDLVTQATWMENDDQWSIAVYFYLWWKICDMSLFTMKCIMRNEQWKIAILHAHFWDFSINIGFNLFPEEISPWTKNVTPPYVIIFDQFTFTYNLRGGN